MGIMKEIYTANQEIADSKSYVATLEHSQRILQIVLDSMKNPLPVDVSDGDDEPADPIEPSDLAD